MFSCMPSLVIGNLLSLLIYDLFNDTASSQMNEW